MHYSISICYCHLPGFVFAYRTVGSCLGSNERGPRSGKGKYQGACMCGTGVPGSEVGVPGCVWWGGWREGMGEGMGEGMCEGAEIKRKTITTRVRKNVLLSG